MLKDIEQDLNREGAFLLSKDERILTQSWRHFIRQNLKGDILKQSLIEVLNETTEIYRSLIRGLRSNLWFLRALESQQNRLRRLKGKLKKNLKSSGFNLHFLRYL